MAYDHFQIHLPACDPGPGPLSDENVAREVARWIWQFGPTPLIAVVEHDGKRPKWVASRLCVDVPWESGRASAVILERDSDLEAFLVEGAPHYRTHFFWPRRSPSRTLDILARGEWKDEVDGAATVAPSGLIEVLQLQPI